MVFSALRDPKMASPHRRGRPRLCPTCGRLIYLNRHGLYRRHFAVEPDGRRHLCAGSGHMAGSAPGGLHRFDLP
jgi:hypothetical protein